VAEPVLRQPITVEQAREALDYDPVTGRIVWKWRSDAPKHINLQYAGKPAGHLDRKGYLMLCFKYHRILAHRMAWFLHHGKWPPVFLDHINGNPIDNRITNLRPATRRENARNMRPHADNKFGVKNICMIRGRYRVRVHKDGRPAYVKMFDTLDAAKAARAEVIKHLHGDFAR
jgi:hypothetical protein